MVTITLLRFQSLSLARDKQVHVYLSTEVLDSLSALRASHEVALLLL